jgi:hypothetical protein
MVAAVVGEGVEVAHVAVAAVRVAVAALGHQWVMWVVAADDHRCRAPAAEVQCRGRKCRGHRM